MIARFFILIFLAIPLLAVAQSDEFTVRLFTGNDVTPPTTPVIQSVVPVSSNQIDVTWSASSDDIIVQGYRVFRDGLQIATTSLTTFIDTGLVASTTYSYEIDAFDYVFNFSSSSVPVATTTLPIIIPPVATSSTSTAPQTGTAVVSVGDFSIETAVTTATLTFSTDFPTVYTVRFGRTREYELGTISNGVFRTEHVSALTGLEPGTRYFVEVILRGPRGGEYVIEESFVTKPALTTDSPLSVTEVLALAEGDDVIMTWQNPEPLEGVVRIVRNYLFYPQDATDGVVVYEGAGKSFTDNNALRQQDAYYYTIFVIAPDGRVSAGAVARVQKRVVGSTSTRPVLPPAPGTTDLSEPFEEGGSSLNPSDVFFTYDGNTIALVALDTLPIGTPVLVSIPRQAVPPNLKTILLSVESPVNNTQVTIYLLKLSADGTAYEARFETSNYAGEGRLITELFDYEEAVMHRITKSVRYEVATGMPLSLESAVWYGTGMVVATSVSLIGFFILLLLWRRREDKS